MDRYTTTAVLKSEGRFIKVESIVRMTGVVSVLCIVPRKLVADKFQKD